MFKRYFPLIFCFSQEIIKNFTTNQRTNMEVTPQPSPKEKLKQLESPSPGNNQLISQLTNNEFSPPHITQSQFSLSSHPSPANNSQLTNNDTSSSPDQQPQPSPKEKLKQLESPSPGNNQLISQLTNNEFSPPHITQSQFSLSSHPSPANNSQLTNNDTSSSPDQQGSSLKRKIGECFRLLYVVPDF